MTKEDLQEEIIAIRQEIESLKNGTDDSAILQGMEMSVSRSKSCSRS